MYLIDSPYLVPTDGSFALGRAPTTPPSGAGDATSRKKRLKKRVKKLEKLQRKLYADDRFAVLLVFQAMDAAGKDGTIRAVMSGVNPAGFQVFGFKQPSDEELDHDFLWRTTSRLPERGRIGVFNRSYYEEVLVVRVHPEYLSGQKLPYDGPLEQLWAERLESIRDHERHLARNGVAVVKLWLNISREEQRRRFVARIDDPAKNWKFSAGDVAESKLWDRYMHAYEEALRATSRPWAPWYAVPADDKDYMRATVADIVVKTLEKLPLRWPEPSSEGRKRMLELRDELSEEVATD
jgi:PPK2 family polyphosphate:nucleotide phosphotransferase